MDNKAAGEAWTYSLENSNVNLTTEDKEILQNLSKLLRKNRCRGTNK